MTPAAAIAVFAIVCGAVCLVAAFIAIVCVLLSAGITRHEDAQDYDHD